MIRPAVAVCTWLSLACSVNAVGDAGGAPSPGFDSSVTGGTTGAEAPNTGGAASNTGGAGVAGSASAPPARARCSAPDGLLAPGTIEEAVQWLNALPKPTTAACFLESLPRPLAMLATSSRFSAQPAFSEQSPRVFIELGRLWVSAVIDGESSYLLEFGYRPANSELESIKGELELPLADVIAANAPYERVRYGSATTCGLCHRNEQPVANLPPGAFVSSAIRPRPETYVSVDALQLEHARCDWSENEHRCEMLASLFDGGAVVETAFPATMPTFF